MLPWPNIVAIGCAAGATISFVIAVPLFYVIGAELRRARKAGEAGNIPVAPKGLPISVLLYDLLPNVRKERRWLIFWLRSFLAFWVVGVVMMAFFGRSNG